MSCSSWLNKYQLFVMNTIIYHVAFSSQAFLFSYSHVTHGLRDLSGTQHYCFSGQASLRSGATASPVVPSLFHEHISSRRCVVLDLRWGWWSVERKTGRIGPSCEAACSDRKRICVVS